MNAGYGFELTPQRFFEPSEAAREAYREFSSRYVRVDLSFEPSGGALLAAALLALSAGLLLAALRRAPPPVGRARGFRRGLLGCCAPAGPREAAACLYACCCSAFAAHEVVADVRPGDACFDLCTILLSGVFALVPCVGFALRCCAAVRRRDASRALVGLGAMGAGGICLEVCVCGPCAVGQELAEARERRARERESGAAKDEEHPAQLGGGDGSGGGGGGGSGGAETLAAADPRPPSSSSSAAAAAAERVGDEADAAGGAEAGAMGAGARRRAAAAR